MIRSLNNKIDSLKSNDNPKFQVSMQTLLTVIQMMEDMKEMLARQGVAMSASTGTRQITIP